MHCDCARNPDDHAQTRMLMVISSVTATTGTNGVPRPPKLEGPHARHPTRRVER